jgi:hypothetical protein
MYSAAREFNETDMLELKSLESAWNVDHEMNGY